MAMTPGLTLTSILIPRLILAICQSRLASDPTIDPHPDEDPDSDPDSTHWQAMDLRQLVSELHDVLADYCNYFWGELETAQIARALVATPYPLCSMSIGVHLSALHNLL